MASAHQSDAPHEAGHLALSKRCFFGIALAVLLVALSGCEMRLGHPSSGPSWRSDADHALDSASSSLGAAVVVVKARVKGRVPRSVVVVALDDAIKGLDKQVDAFLRSRPPSRRTHDDDRVVHVLLESLATLHSIDLAAAGPEPVRWREALQSGRSGLSKLAAIRDDVLGDA